MQAASGAAREVREVPLQPLPACGFVDGVYSLHHLPITLATVTQPRQQQQQRWWQQWPIGIGMWVLHPPQLLVLVRRHARNHRMECRELDRLLVAAAICTNGPVPGSVHARCPQRGRVPRPAITTTSVPKAYTLEVLQQDLVCQRQEALSRRHNRCWGDDGGHAVDRWQRRRCWQGLCTTAVSNARSAAAAPPASWRGLGCHALP